MSEIRSQLEQQAQNGRMMVKVFKILGWVFIGIGVMLCLTVVGIVVGAILIAAGFCILKFLPKFFAICSVILIATGVMQVFVRPRKDKETLAERLVNRSTITAFISVAVGIVGLLLGAGVIPMVHLNLGR